MIYLREDKDKLGITINKVGFTDNFYQRNNSYKIHSPSGEIVAIMEGSLMDEQILHKYLRLKLQNVYLEEWYDKCSEVTDLFKDYNKTFEKVDKFLWENRDKAFTDSDLKDDDWYNYYKKLERTYKRLD